MIGGRFITNVIALCIDGDAVCRSEMTTANSFEVWALCTLALPAAKNMKICRNRLCLSYNQLSEERTHCLPTECGDILLHHPYPDQTDRFIRAVLLIPIIGHEETLEYGVWVSSAKEFLTTIKATSTIRKMSFISGWSAMAAPYEIKQHRFALQYHYPTRWSTSFVTQLHQGSEHPLVRDFYHGIEYAESAGWDRAIIRIGLLRIKDKKDEYEIQRCRDFIAMLEQPGKLKHRTRSRIWKWPKSPTACCAEE